MTYYRHFIYYYIQNVFFILLVKDYRHIYCFFDYQVDNYFSHEISILIFCNIYQNYIYCLFNDENVDPYDPCTYDLAMNCCCSYFYHPDTYFYSYLYFYDTFLSWNLIYDDCSYDYYSYDPYSYSL